MITSPSNQHIAALRALHTPKGRAEAGAFLIEGPHLVDVALDARILPQLLVYDPDHLARTEQGQRLLSRLGALAAQGIPVYEAAPPAIDRASDTRTPQGIAGSVALEDVAPDKVRGRRRGRNRPVVAILDAIADPGNLGTILRSALAADADEVWCAPGCADPMNPKVVRAASGASFFLPVRADLSWDEIAERLRGAPAVRQVLLAEAGAKQPYSSVDLTRRTGLIIGNEAHGPSPEARHLTTQPITIPMWNSVESLNAAVAASVILFEAARQRREREEALKHSEQPEPRPGENNQE